MDVGAQGTHKAAGQPVKYQMDEEMTPDTLLEIDAQKVSSIQEVSQMVYPFDGSVIKVDHCAVGGSEFKKSLIIKDNLAFGLRKAVDRGYESGAPQGEEYGLVYYKKVGDTDFWMRFENDTKVLVEALPKRILINI